VIVEFELIGMTFEADGTLDPGDRGGWHEPPTPPFFEIDNLFVREGGQLIDAGWLFSSNLGQRVADCATEAAIKAAQWGDHDE